MSTGPSTYNVDKECCQILGFGSGLNRNLQVVEVHHEFH